MSVTKLTMELRLYDDRSKDSLSAKPPRLQQKRVNMEDGTSEWVYVPIFVHNP